MQINQEFRIREDLESYIVFFKGDAPLEMSEVAAFIAGLLKEDITRERIIDATAVNFDDIEAEAEVDHTLQMLRDAGILDEE